MLLYVCLVFLPSVVTAYPFSTTSFHYSTAFQTMPPPPEKVQLLVSPDYPVAGGQRVDMSCTAGNVHHVSDWLWERQENNGSWTTVSKNKDLTLSKPEQSGKYRCFASNHRGHVGSPERTVYIVSIHATASDNVGVAGFVLSLLTLLISLAVVFWLVWQKFCSTLTVPQTSTTGPSKPVKEPKPCLQQDEADRDVYMNYTSSNQAYSDLDPNNMTEDNLYSSLS